MLIKSGLINLYALELYMCWDSAKTISGNDDKTTNSISLFNLECPAEFRVTEFRWNFAEFFPGIPPELSYGIPYFLRNSVCMRNSAFLRNSVCYGIPYLNGIPRNTEFRIAEFSIPSIRNFYGIPPKFRIPYHEFRQKKTPPEFFLTE